MPYSKHLRSYADLITTEEQRRAAFLATMIEKNERSSPLVEQAKALRMAVVDIGSPLAILDQPELHNAMRAAAGVCDFDTKQLSPEEVNLAIQLLIEEHLLRAGNVFPDELAYRYLLCKGESRDDSLQRLTGFVARHRFGRAVAAGLVVRDVRMLVKLSDSAQWVEWNSGHGDLPQDIRGLAWSTADRPRTLLFNSRVDSVGKVFDVVLRRFGGGASDVDAQRGPGPSVYLGFGEIAGFDHPERSWKRRGQPIAIQTRAKFAPDSSPAMFYLGSDIGEATARELWSDLEGGVLSNAANIQSDEQLASLCEWLIQL